MDLKVDSEHEINLKEEAMMSNTPKRVSAETTTELPDDVITIILSKVAMHSPNAWAIASSRFFFLCYFTLLVFIYINRN